MSGGMDAVRARIPRRSQFSPGALRPGPSWVRSLLVGGVVVIFLLTGFVGMSGSSAPVNPASLPTLELSWLAKSQILSRPAASPIPVQPAAASFVIGPNIDVSNELGPQSETSIAISPENPLQIVAGSNEIERNPMRGYFSSDGGTTWGAVDLPLPPPDDHGKVDFGSDPGVAWDTKGNVYYSYIVVFFSANFVAVTGSELAVARSSDGGATWTSTYFAFAPNKLRFDDKPMITVDTNLGSPFLNTIYVAWDITGAIEGSANGLVESHSTDGGLKFSAPVFASSTVPGFKSDIGADPFVGPDGTLFVAWHDLVHKAIVVSSSSDGGQTFGRVHTIALTRLGIDAGIPAEGSRHALVYPACGADGSSGPDRGFLYCSWMDQTPANGADIFFSRSTDRGLTWSPPVRVNDDPTGVENDQFNQWLAVDPTDGAIHISWSDTRLDPKHLSTNEFYARSTDGGLHFSKNIRVTNAPTDETEGDTDFGNQYGDYEGIAAFGGVAHPIWTDRRASVASLDEEVFTATVTPS